jgi:site-specific DNA recombinase
MTIRAAIYARVSSERQAGADKVSIYMQVRDCEKFCEDRGYKVVERYVDKEKYRSKGKLVQPSGQRKDRPQYRAMLKAAHNDEFDIVIAWRQDRLFRGMFAAMPLAELLDDRDKSLNVELVSEQFDPKMLGIRAAIGKIEVDNIRERSLMGRRARLERGEPPGGDQQPYGYRKADRHLEIEADEAEVVRNIFRWYIAGESLNQIRTRLDRMGVLPRRAKRWAKSTIQSILAKDAYATGYFNTKLDGEDFEIPCEEIISMATWEQAEAVRDGNRRRYKARNVQNNYLCAGIVFCICGWKCSARTTHALRSNGEVKQYGYYCCQRQDSMRDNHPGCARSTGVSKLDAYVWDHVKRICSNPSVVESAIRIKLGELEIQNSSLDSEVASLKRDLDELVDERQWVITSARKGLITDSDMEHQLQQIEDQSAYNQKRLDDLQATQSAKRKLRSLVDWAGEFLKDIMSGIQILEQDVAEFGPEEREALYSQLEAWRFAESSPNDKRVQLEKAILEEKRRIVRTVISRVIVGKDPSGKGRIITPEMALDVPYDHVVSTAHGHQSLEYINAGTWKVTLEPEELGKL